jgi:two-component system, sensor histidine kinase RegB
MDPRTKLETGDATRSQLSVPAISLAWLLRLRWVAAALQAVTVVVSLALFRMKLPVGALALLVFATLGSNGLLEAWRRQAGHVPEAIVPAVMVFDVLVLTALLYFSGGPANPFSVLYLVNATIAALVLPLGWAWAIVALSSGSYALLFFEHVPVSELGAHMMEGGEFSLHLQGMWVAFTLAATVITYFVSRVARALGRREIELAEARDAAARNELLASLTTLAAGAAHELGTPLGTIAVAAGELGRELEAIPSAAPLLDDARLIREELARCRAILDRMSGRAGSDADEPPAWTRPTDLFEAVKAAVGDVRSERLVLASQPNEVSVCVRGAALAQVLATLANNALDASQGAVELHVDAGIERVRFSVRDAGAGMSADVLKHVGEPFFTTKAPGAGMGLGVFLARAFAARSGGALRLESGPGRGTTAILELPNQEAAHE